MRIPEIVERKGTEVGLVNHLMGDKASHTSQRYLILATVSIIGNPALCKMRSNPKANMVEIAAVCLSL